jgi:dipeptidyl aminopeptidase/acylaminoacyl peptidase
MRLRELAAAGLLLCALAPAMARAEVDLDRYLKPDTYGTTKISPTGEYFAVTMNLPDRSVLIIQRRSDGKITAKAAGNEHSEVADFWWVNDHRVMVAMAEKLGSRDTPVSTGELYGVNADGSNPKMLIGAQSQDRSSAAMVIDVSGSTYQYAELIDTLPKDPQHVLVSVSSYSAEPSTRVVRMDVDNGRTTDVAKAPVNRARFAADQDGVVRFAEGKDFENFSRLLYRPDDHADWTVVNDERSSKRVEWPLGFSADGKTAFLEVEQAAGPDAIVAFEPASGKRTEVLRDKLVDPDFLFYAKGGFTPVGASFVSDGRHARFFDEDGDDALLQRTLENAFPDLAVSVTSRTADGQQALVAVWSDTNPGDFYLFDERDKSAKGLFSRRLWLDPAKMQPTRAIDFAARDGTALHGYLTLPKNAKANAPLVVIPHGGPFGISDTWDFDGEVQLLAEAGYAVLRVNFRGSGNYGRSFRDAGARQWGGLMQDDVTDATRWAIAQGLADPKRICLYGASYGAYSAMMGLAREPDLYRCGVGYVGVYDLPLMARSDARKATWLKNWMNDWVGPASTLDAVSPTQLAARIRAPVFLAAGGKDLTAPVDHTRKLEKALKAAGNAPQTLYYDNEGHGFYTEEHRRAFYVQLLDFLAANLGGQRAKAPAPAPAAK